MSSLGHNGFFSIPLGGQETEVGAKEHSLSPERGEETTMNWQRIQRGFVLWSVFWCCVALAGAAAAGEPKPGGTLKIGQVGGILNFDAHRLSKGNYPMLTLVYNTLIRYDDTLTPQPELAESWTFSKDGMTLEFKVREGVKFHNGRELVAEDVVWNIQRVQDPKTAAHVRPLSLAIKSAEATGRLRVPPRRLNTTRKFSARRKSFG